MNDITVIGLGAMGSALATCLMERGLGVTVWNRSADKAATLVDRGARLADSPREAVRDSPVTVVSVLDYAAAQGILDQAEEALSGRTLVNLTNGTPAQARRMAAWVEGHGAGYVDGAVMVTPEMVGGPDAFLLYSGNESAFGQHEDALSTLGNSTFIGENVASAAIYDLALLASMFGMFGGYLHAAALLRSEGIPVSRVAPMIMSLLKAMIELYPAIAREVDTGEYASPSSNNAMMAAALKNILDGSREQKVREDLLTPVWQLFDQSRHHGLGESDISALVPLLEAGDSD
jgi:3-hydroxyisobutyrate dehydrogenase-like beta-hydroxyacid dehydrogenase